MVATASVTLRACWSLGGLYVAPIDVSAFIPITEKGHGRRLNISAWLATIGIACVSMMASSQLAINYKANPPVTDGTYAVRRGLA